MKKLFKRKSAISATPAPVEPEYNWHDGPTQNPNGNVWFDWSPEYANLWIRPRPAPSSGETPRASFADVTKFVKLAMASKTYRKSITILCTNASGMFPSSISISVDGDGRMVMSNSCFCTPEDVDASTYHKIAEIIKALGYDDAQLTEIMNEWRNRYNSLMTDGEQHTLADVELSANIRKTAA